MNNNQLQNQQEGQKNPIKHFGYSRTFNRDGCLKPLGYWQIRIGPNSCAERLVNGFLSKDNSMYA